MTVREYIENDMPENTSDYVFVIRDISTSPDHIPSPLVFKNLKEVTSFYTINEFESILNAEIKTVDKVDSKPILYITMPKCLTITSELYSKLIGNYFTETTEKTMIDMLTFFDLYHDVYIKR